MISQLLNVFYLSFLANKGRHSGHWRVDPGDLTVWTRNMTIAQKQLAAQCNQISFGVDSTTALINIQDELGIRYSDEQIRFLNNQENEKLSNLSTDASSADKLIEAFKRRTDVAFMTVTYLPSEGIMLSVSNKQRKSLKQAVYLNQVRYEKDSLKTRDELDLIYNSSITQEGGRLLLMFIFASMEELRLTRMFPEVCACDTTFATNNQKKELVTLAFLDGNNKVRVYFSHSYICSEFISEGFSDHCSQNYSEHRSESCSKIVFEMILLLIPSYLFYHRLLGI